MSPISIQHSYAKMKLNQKSVVKKFLRFYHRFRTMITVVKTTNSLWYCFHNEKKLRNVGLNQLRHGEHAWVLKIHVRNVKYGHFVFLFGKNRWVKVQHLRRAWRLPLMTTTVQKLIWVYIDTLKQKIPLTYFMYTCGEYLWSLF